MKTCSKYLASVLALSLCLTACGGETQNGSTEPSGESTVLETALPQADPGETTPAAVTEAPAETTQPVEPTQPEETTQPEEILPALDFDKSVSFPETLLYNSQNLKITVKSLSYLEDRAVLNLSIENSGQRDYSLSWNEDASPILEVNGRFLPVYGEPVLVLMGETVETAMDLPYEMLRNRGIRRIEEITFQMDEGEFSTGPMTLSTGNGYEPFLDQAEQDPGALSWTVQHFSRQQAFYRGDVSHVGTVLYQNLRGETFLCLDFENIGFEVRILDLSDVTINGLQLLQKGNMLTLFPHSHAQYVLNLTEAGRENCLDLLGIPEAGSLSFTASVYDQHRRGKAAPMEVTIPLNDGVPAFAGGGEKIAEEDGITLFYVGTRENQGNLNLYLLWENRTGGEFFAQTNELQYEGKDLDLLQESVSLRKDGYAVQCIPIWKDQRKEITPGSGRFTLKALLKTGNSRKLQSFEIPNS